MALTITHRHVAAMMNLDHAAFSEQFSRAESLGAKQELSLGTMRIGLQACYGWLCDALRECFRPGAQPGDGSGLPASGEIDMDELLHSNSGQTQEEPVLDAGDQESFAPPKGTETVLLVDDEPLVRGYMATMLRELGYTVFEAASGVDALQIVQKKRAQNIHLVLTDMVMPQMGGRELGYRAGLLCPEIKVLFCSSYPEALAIRNGMIDNRIPYIQKPVSRDALALKVRQLFDQPTQDVPKTSPTPELVHVPALDPSAPPVETGPVSAVNS